MLRKLAGLFAAYRRTGEPDADRTGTRSKGLRGLKPALRILTLGLLVAVFAWIGLRMLRSPARSGTRVRSKQQALAAGLYRELERALVKRGQPRPPAVTPLEHARKLRAEGFAQRAEVDLVTRSYLEARYGGRPLRTSELAELRRAIARVRKPAA
jgi:hypothetical protein